MLEDSITRKPYLRHTPCQDFVFIAKPFQLWVLTEDGIFKKFITRARKNYEDSQKSKETVNKELSIQEAMADFFANLELGVDTFKTINGSEFTILSVDDRHINISIPGNATANKLSLNLDEVRRMLESGLRFEKIKDITTFFGKSFASQAYSYDFASLQSHQGEKICRLQGSRKADRAKKIHIYH